MQNAGQQYCQGGSTSHPAQAANFGQTEPSNTNNGGSTTSSLRQFRRKVEEKHQSQDTSQRQIPESHVARVAPQNHYPPRTSECFRYPNQYQDYSYSVPSQVKYSEISEPPQSVHQEHIPPASVIHKAKGTKDYMEICNPPHVVKQPYNDLHMNNQQGYNDVNHLPQAQYIPKDTQVQPNRNAVHPLYKPESQYFPKEPQYPAQLQHQMQKYSMPPSAQARKFPSSENEFLSKLQQINPMVARSILSDHHLQEPQKTYQNMDQTRMYPLHNSQRYMNHHPSTMQGNHYPHAGFMPPQPYPNYPSSCNYARSPQMSQPRFPSMSPHERSISPRRSFSDGMAMSMNYPGIPPKISPNYPQYNSPDFAQHYQQRRPSISQDYYQQHCRPTQYLPHQIQAQEIPESRVTVSDSIKQYIENWADEETASEMNQTEVNRYNKDGLRVRDDQLSETVFTINASELQYLEPLGESENGIPLVTSVSIDNTSGMIRIVDKNGEFSDHNGERIVNVHIMEPSTKSDCMLAANKPLETNQRTHDAQFNNAADKSRIIIQQNTVIQANTSQSLNLTKDQNQTGNATLQTKVGSSLPIITDEQDAAADVNATVVKACKKEVVDKNCSPINMEEIEALKEDRDYPANLISNIDVAQKSIESDLFELNLPHIPNIEPYTEDKIEEKPRENNAVVKNVQDDAPTLDEPKSQATNQNSKEEFKPVSEETKEIVEEASKTTDNEVANEEIEKNTENNDKTEEKVDKTKDKIETKKVLQQPKDKNNKRAKRIFSVDDIINNIGQNAKKSKKETERRHSLHSVMEFLDKELNNTFVFDAKEKEREAKKTSTSSENVNKTDNGSLSNTKNVTVSETNKVTLSETNNVTLSETNNVTASETNNVTVSETNNVTLSETNNVTLSETNNVTVSEANNVTLSETNNVTLSETNKDAKITEDGGKDDHNSAKIDEKTNSSQSADRILMKKPAPDETSQSSQDLQLRNVIKVEEPNVLLHIAGELVEINVTTVNGKKVITVTPMSSSTMVDFNDNYETLDGNDVSELMKFDEPEASGEETHVLEIETVVPEVDCVEPSSEVIIGMDLSLEEEIKLDVAQPQVICTKAAKKAYDNDLQIPSITTSDDVNNQSDAYTSNDKVSSSKEKHAKDSSEEADDSKTSKSEREKLREFRKSKPHPQERTVVEEEDDDDEFVPFKELIKARKMKKMKMLESKKSEEIVKADSTNKEDEVVVKENVIDVKDYKKKEKKEKDESKSALDDVKKRKSSSSKTKSSRDSERRHKDKHRSSEKSVKVKSRSEKKKSVVEKVVEHKDGAVSEETPKISHSPKKSDKQTDKTPETKMDKVSNEDKETKENKASDAELGEKLQLTVIEGRIKENSKESKSVLSVRSLSSDKSTLSSTQSEKSTLSEKNTLPERNPLQEKSPLPEKSPLSVKIPLSVKLPLSEKSPLPEKSTLPEKSPLSDKISQSEKSPLSGKSPLPGKRPLVEKSPLSEKTVPSEKTTLPEPHMRPVITPTEKAKPVEKISETKKPSGDKPKRSKESESGDRKKKLSLQEYNSRKRKLSDKNESRPKKIDLGEVPKTFSVVRARRPKSLDDLEALKEPKSSSPQVKRKFSLGSLAAPNHFDWDETQSPKRNFDIREKRFSEFSGLINDKSNPKPVINPIEDKSLQNYREKVESKLSSLNIQIPKSKIVNPEDGELKSETSELMHKFLQSDKLTATEMDKIKKIISYKRLFQQLDKVKQPQVVNKSTEVKSDSSDVKVHAKKQIGIVKKKKKRFRNLYGAPSSSDSEDVPVETKTSTSGDYSVVQSNCLAGVVPKLIIKRRPEMPLPFVKLERLDLDVLYQEKRVCID